MRIFKPSKLFTSAKTKDDYTDMGVTRRTGRQVKPHGKKPKKAGKGGSDAHFKPNPSKSSKSEAAKWFGARKAGKRGPSPTRTKGNLSKRLSDAY